MVKYLAAVDVGGPDRKFSHRRSNLSYPAAVASAVRSRLLAARRVVSGRPAWGAGASLGGDRSAHPLCAASGARHRTRVLAGGRALSVDSVLHLTRPAPSARTGIGESSCLPEHSRGGCSSGSRQSSALGPPSVCLRRSTAWSNSPCSAPSERRASSPPARVICRLGIRSAGSSANRISVQTACSSM